MINGENIIAVILAGGFGTRVQHLLPGIPKPMAPVAGKPFLEWIVRYLDSQGISRIILATGYLSEAIEKYFKENPIPGLSISCCCEETPLGTGGGFVNAVVTSGKRPSAWLVLNGDSLFLANFSEIFKHLYNPQVDGVIAGIGVDDACRYGSLIYDEHRNLTGFAEKKLGSGIVNAGVYLLRSSTVENFSRGKSLSFEYDIFPKLLRTNHCLKVEIFNVPFLDIGTPETLSQAELFIIGQFEHLNPIKFN